jgi:hypothetical protein
MGAPRLLLTAQTVVSTLGIFVFCFFLAQALYANGDGKELILASVPVEKTD